MADRSVLKRGEVLRRRLVAGVGWISGLDGGLLTDASWRRRNLVVCSLVTAGAVVTIPLALRERHGPALWLLIALLVLAQVTAWLPLPRRRVRVLAVVVACVVSAAIQSRYIANLSPLSSAYLVLLSVYQDWLPLVAGVAGSLVLPLLAIVSPGTLEQWRAFQRETPATGAAVRTLGVLVAALVAILVWRANGVATRDGLTGLATRDYAERRLLLALRSGRTPAVLVCDVDAFRLAADDLPRAAADGLIRDVGQRLREASSEFETILAVGGGAKYILIHTASMDVEAAEALARHICQAVAGTPFLINGAGIPLTVTVGIAVGQPGDEASDLIRAADLAMHGAKGRGDAAIAVAPQPALGMQPRPDGPITAELRQAVEHGEFVMYYQPLADLRTGVIVGAEALVRWQHPTRGLLGPDAFLAYGEAHPWLNAAISDAIGYAVLRQTAIWDEAFPGRLSAGVALNLAPSRLKDPALCEGFATMIRETGVNPAGLVIELTEGAVMDLEIDVPAILGDIAALGARIGLDDFGTGHSSLAHLRDFPLHEVKIDRSFVTQVAHSASDQAVVRAVLAISSQFGAEVVIEGIETHEQWNALLAMESDAIAQGFLFARPMPATDFTALLETGRTLP